MSVTSVGSAAWTHATAGRLTRAERSALVRVLSRSHLENVVGRTRLALGRYPGRRTEIDLETLQPPDSALTRAAVRRAGALLSPALLNHSHRCYAWGAAFAQLDQVAFDPELLYVAALLHDTGLAAPVAPVATVAGADFTVASAAVAGELLEQHGVGRGDRQVILDSICRHHTPGVSIADGAEQYLLSSGAALDVFGVRSWDLPEQLRTGVVADFPRLGFKSEFARAWAAESRRVPGGRAQLLRRYAASDLTIRLAPFPR